MLIRFIKAMFFDDPIAKQSLEQEHNLGLWCKKCGRQLVTIEVSETETQTGGIQYECPVHGKAY